MKNYITALLGIVFCFSLVSCDRSCDGLNPDMRKCRFGCMDEKAVNYDSEATIRDNSCSYFNKPATVTFNVENEYGGPVFVHAECNKIGTYFSEDFKVSNFDRFECGDSNAASIKLGRTFGAKDDDDWVLNYVASDSLGNNMSGSIILNDGDCQVINLDRKSPGRVLFYARDFSAVRVTLLYTGELFDPENYAYDVYASIPIPVDCDEHYTFELSEGTYKWKATENSLESLDQYEGTFEITPGSCEIISLKD